MIIKVTHPDMPGLAKVIVSEDSVPHTVYVEGAQLLHLVQPTIAEPWNAEHFDELRKLGCTVDVVDEKRATSERIALFCKWYKHFKNVPYRTSAAESGMIKNITVSEALLKFYLDERTMPENSTTWLWRGKQSIGNLVKFYNQVRAAMAAPPESKSKHPDHWSPEHFKKLDGPGITEYHRHLKSLGLVATKARDGSVIDYIPASDARTE